MTLLDLCEPLFLYICRLSRMSRSMASNEYAVVRGDIKGLLEDIQQKANTDVRLSHQAEKMRMPLMFFVDSMISESNLPFAGEWNRSRLAYEENELAGDEKFFHPLLEQTLPDMSDDASERLAVFYTCLGLGFTGFYTGQPEQLRKFMNQMLPRIKNRVDQDETARICKEAYENVDTRNLVEPPSAKMGLILALFLFFAVSVFATYCWMFRDASSELRKALDAIVQQDK